MRRFELLTVFIHEGSRAHFNNCFQGGVDKRSGLKNREKLKKFVSWKKVIYLQI